MGWEFFNSSGAVKRQDGVSTLVPMDTWHVVGAVGEPAFQGTWVNNGGAYAPAAFRKYPDGRVRLRGCVKSGAIGSVIFTLPVGYRPPQAGIYSASDWNTTYAVGERYIDTAGNVTHQGANATTQIFLDGIEFDTESVLSYPATPAGQVPRVTALPAGPVDGQEVYYVADATNGVLWHLKYNAGSASAYKWESVGGAALSTEVVTDQSTSSTTFVDLGTVGPSITLPLAGDFDIALTCGFYSGIANQAALMSYAIGATAAVDADGVLAFETGANLTQASFSRERRKTFATAGTALVAKYRVGSANAGDFTNRRMAARPVRVG